MDFLKENENWLFDAIDTKTGEKRAMYLFDMPGSLKRTNRIIHNQQPTHRCDRENRQITANSTYSALRFLLLCFNQFMIDSSSFLALYML